MYCRERIVTSVSEAVSPVLIERLSFHSPVYRLRGIQNSEVSAVTKYAGASMYTTANSDAAKQPEARANTVRSCGANAWLT